MYKNGQWRGDYRKHGQRNQRYTPRQNERADITAWANGETHHLGTGYTYHNFEAAGILTFIRWRLSRPYPEICIVEFAGMEDKWMSVEADPTNAEALRVAAVNLMSELEPLYSRWRTLKNAGRLDLL